jgi:hypothetical protein
VVKVADDELFGPDGTQAPPAPPFLSDPLAGLVTGVLFSDTTAVADVVPTFVVDPVAPSATRARRRTAAAPARSGAQPLTAATAPAASAVAAPLSAKPGIQQSRPPANRATQIGSQPTTYAPARPAPPRTSPANWQNTRPPPALRGTPGRPVPPPARQAPVRRRRAGAGCSLILVVFVVLVIAFVVLGVLVGHGTGSGFGG